MTIGTTANLAAAMTAIEGSRGPGAMPPVERLALLLVSDAFGMGATLLDLGKLHALLGTDDPADARTAVEGLARRGLVRLSQWRDGVAFAGSIIASDEEVADARSALGLDWEFRDWTGAT